MLVPLFARAAALVAAFAFFAAAAHAGDFPDGVRDTLGPQFAPAPAQRNAKPAKRGPAAIDRLHFWNQVAVDASGLDHTPAAAGENRVFGEQLGPGRSSRAMAIVHIAVFDAVNAVEGGYQSYTGSPRAKHSASVDAAIATAAHDALVALYPSQAAQLDAILADDLSDIQGSANQKSDGIDVGRQAAAAILAMRANDGSHHSEPLWVDYAQDAAAGHWRQDPI